MTYDIGITLLFLLTTGLWFKGIMENQKLRGVLRTALRVADNYKPGGRDHVRIPYNQLALLIGWKPECFQRDDKFTGKPGPHPSALSSARRRKLKKG